MNKASNLSTFRSTYKVHTSQLPKNFIYGINPIAEAIKAGYLKRLFVLNSLIISNRRVKELVNLAGERGIKVEEMGIQRWIKALYGAQHQGVAGIIRNFTGTSLVDVLRDFQEKGAVVLLDGVNDPHNLGAVIRNAASVGATVILPKTNVPSINATVHKVSAGCTFITKIVLDQNLSQAINRLKKEDFWVTALDPHHGTSIFDFEFPKRFVAIFGSEERGVRQKLIEKSDYLLRIPMAEGVDSLNLSTAVAVTLYFYKRWQEMGR